jgi:hypothetical protein
MTHWFTRRRCHHGSICALPGQAEEGSVDEANEGSTLARATASSGIVIPGPGAGADTGMKRFRGERPWGKRHDAEETADARDTTA